ncbi:hypothetical protein [Actinomadura roseirufa]|uniref:hypothetical protein n=1 Tax=Actinomadura roseirufa TaxID=2094049 RepID=UPI001041375C|nr:hypothetical protein [Actinomadura roseirufa]
MRKTNDGVRGATRDYEIRIRGRVDAPFRLAFEDLSITLNPVETVMRGADLDQAALYGILERIQDLGFELIEVRRLPPAPST